MELAIDRAARIADGFLCTGGIGLDMYAQALERNGKKPEEGSVDDLLADLDNDDNSTAGTGQASDFLEVNEVGAGAQDNFGIEVSEEAGLDIDLDPEIFRAYDIRGITTTNLTEEVVYWIGKAFAAEALAANRSRASVSVDGSAPKPNPMAW